VVVFVLIENGPHEGCDDQPDGNENTGDCPDLVDRDEELIHIITDFWDFSVPQRRRAVSHVCGLFRKDPRYSGHSVRF